ncbi:NADH dehydrogenase subunit 4 (mitochondrion) [Macrosteles quadrilineatus]|uniref:NADH-ubiquinone oxidoreductase chain 4 n=1 Tax=Macrosteles quadrilineatus TaxID=74068 RepID=A0A343CXA9_MACQU|nr:NADH dehydrogenase subunit 4 [Macrosteles quadrilineatus]ARQ26991.1 NADH dehydrogenase subunit 4 [Macrosteles quadrilineatus]
MMSLILMVLFLIPMILIMHSSILFQYFYIIMYMYMLLYKSPSSIFSSISYMLGLDYFSYGFMLLTFLISSYMIISMMNFSNNFLYFMLLNLMMTFFLVIIFSSMNFLYMYISFEFILIPLIILILGWGYQPERLMAGMYLFFYTVLVSLPLLLLIMYMYMYCGSMFFGYMVFSSENFLIHFILIVVFMVKMPMYLTHYWLPKAHVQAPVSGSMILAALMLKIGGYGFIRVMYMYEYMLVKYSYIWFTFGIVGSLFISIICLIQGDIKCLVAYSSVAHMGMVLCGLMTMNTWGILGSYFLMIAHGFCSSGLFYICNLFYIRTMSRSFFINKGLINFMPTCCMFFFMLCAFNMSCPPSLNFVSELMILPSLMNFWSYSMYFFIGISFFSACFSYYLYSFSQHGLYHNLYTFSMINLLEFLCLFMHLFPLFLIPVFISTLM